MHLRISLLGADLFEVELGSVPADPAEPCWLAQTVEDIVDSGPVEGCCEHECGCEELAYEEDEE